MKDWDGWAIAAASRTRKVTRPAGRGWGAMLTAMRFSSDRAVLAPWCDFRTIRLRQIAGDHTIGNLVANPACPR